MDDNAIEILLRLRDELTPALAQAQDALRTAAGQLAATGGAGSSAFKDMENGANGFSTAALEGIPIIGQLIGALSVERMVEFASATIETTARIEELALASGVSNTELQKFTYVGQNFNIASEAMAKGVEQLSTRLANGDASAVGAVQMLGLSVKALIAAGPAEAFLEVADATGRIQDPMMKSALASSEFSSRLAKELIPVLADLRKKYNDVPQNALINDIAIRSAADFETAVAHAKTQVEAFLDRVLFAWSGGWTGQMQDAKKAIEDCQKAFERTGASGISNADLLNNRLTALRTEALQPLTQAQKDNIVELESYGVGLTEIAQLVGTTTVTIQAWENGIKSAADATRIMGEVEAEADAQLMTSYTSRIKVLGDLSKASLSAYSFGAQLAALAQLDAAEQVLAVDVEHSLTNEQDRAKVRAEAIKAHIDLLNQESTVQQKQLQLTNAAQQAEFDAQVKLNAEWGRNASGAIAMQKTALDLLNQAMDELHRRKVDGFSQSAQEQVLIDAYTKSLYDDAIAQDTLTQSVIGNTKAISDNIIQKQQAAAFSLAGGSAVPSQFAGMTTAQLFSAGLVDALGRVTMSGAAAGLGTSAGGATAATFGGTRDSGGPVMPGNAYLIGKGAQPEMFIPSSPGTMVPNGAGGDVHYHLAISVTQPLGTPDAIAKAVDDALMARQRNTGTRFPGLA